MLLKKIAIKAKPYLIALGSTILFLLFALTLFRFLGLAVVFILFLPAVMVGGWFGGVLSGLITSVLISLLVYYFFIPPYTVLLIKPFMAIGELVVLLIQGVVVTYIIDNTRGYEKIQEYKKQDKENKKTIQELQKDLAIAKQEVASRDEFLAIASHELKTPLTTVVLQIQTTLHNIRNVSLSEFSVEHLLRMLQSMQNQTKRLTQMINDLLNISLITTHKMELEKEEVDLATLITDVAESFKEKFEREGSYITVDIHDSVVGKWDKLRLEQVLDNLISNALKYGNKKPVSIELHKEKENVLIHVVDNGIGIKNGDKTTIFSLFKRGESERNYKGLGIGLYIAQQIIMLHKGHIEVKNNPDGGTIFTVYLPMIKE